MNDHDRWRCVLDDWIRRLADDRVLMGQRDAVAADLEGWLAFLEQAASGDAAAAHELFKRVAFHARELGAEARPASATLTQAFDLLDALGTLQNGVPRELTELMREVARVAMDAHALGLAERIDARHQREIRRFSPVVQVDAETVVAFMLGEMRPDNMDAIVGRLLRQSVLSGATTAVLDLLGADDPDERFFRTIAALLEAEGSQALRDVVITGVRESVPIGDVLAARDAERVPHLKLERSLGEYLLARRR